MAKKSPKLKRLAKTKIKKLKKATIIVLLNETSVFFLMHICQKYLPSYTPLEI